MKAKDINLAAKKIGARVAATGMKARIISGKEKAIIVVSTSNGKYVIGEFTIFEKNGMISVDKPTKVLATDTYGENFISDVTQRIKL